MAFSLHIAYAIYRFIVVLSCLAKNSAVLLMEYHANGGFGLRHATGASLAS